LIFRDLLSIGLLSIVGCGTPGISVNLAPVTGVFTKEGKPLADIKVMLESRDPTSKAPMLFGLTNAEGKYEIQTSAGEKGAPVGLYKVFLTQTQAPAEFDYSKAKSGGPPKVTDVIPANYQSSNTTELSVDVIASGTNFDIAIK